MERVVLTTSRLHLATWSLEDREIFRPIATDPEVMRYITGGAPWTDAQVDEFIARQMRTQEAHGYCLWKLLLNEDAQRLGGFCGLQPLEGTSEIEIGWWLARDLWGRGLATEAAKAVIEFAWRGAGLRRVVAVAMQENATSRRLMEKLGMSFERETIHKGVTVVLYFLERPVFRAGA